MEAPDGVRWSVVRRVLPWRPRLRRERLGIEHLDPISLALQLLSLPLLLVEVLLASLVLLPRILLRRPWRVEALTVGPPRQRLTWRIPGFAAAGAHAEAVAAAIAAQGAGPTPPDERHVG